MDLQADRPRLDRALRGPRDVRSGRGLQTEVHRQALERLEGADHPPRGLLEPGRHERGDAGRQGDGNESGTQKMDVRVDRAGRDEQAMAGDRPGPGADRQVDAVHDVRVAGPPDTHDAAVLDADVGLDDPDQRIDDDRAADHGVELALGRRAVVLAHPRAQVLRVAPQDLIGGLGQVRFDPYPEIGIAQSHPVADRGPVSERVLLP